MHTTPSPAGCLPAQAAKSLRQILVEARALISDPSHWTTDSYARAANGNAIGPNTPNACRFCSLGAIAKSSGECVGSFSKLRSNTAGTLAVIALEAAMDGWVPNFNDSREHAEVLAAFDLAIASLPEAA